MHPKMRMDNRQKEHTIEHLGIFNTHTVHTIKQRHTTYTNTHKNKWKAVGTRESKLACFMKMVNESIVKPNRQNEMIVYASEVANNQSDFIFMRMKTYVFICVLLSMERTERTGVELITLNSDATNANHFENQNKHKKRPAKPISFPFLLIEKCFMIVNDTMSSVSDVLLPVTIHCCNQFTVKACCCSSSNAK